MKSFGVRFVGMISLVLFLAFSIVAKSETTKLNKDKIKPEELIAKHLDSIGSAEARVGLKSIMAIGASKAIFKGRGKGLTQGIVVLASQGVRNMIGMKFKNPDYQYETMGYDGKNLTIGFSKPGTRSTLGGFLRVNKKTFKRGLMGGVLSTSWELYNYDKKRGKLKYSGTKKSENGTLIKFDYNPKGGSDLSVTLFFDSTTYRHMKTEYRRVITSKLGTNVDNSASQSETRYKMTEQFGDFRVENGLTLPHDYNLYLEILTGNGSIAYDWTMDLRNFIFNQNHDVSQFRVDAVN